MKTTIIYLSVLLSFAMNLSAQTYTVKLWQENVPNAKENPGYVEKLSKPWGSDCFEKIKDPELLVYKPSKEKDNGVAILVCPGGGYQYVSIVNEGYDIAKWLNGAGITAVILKYRLPSDEIMKNKTIGPLQDAQEAMRVIRRNYLNWNINPSKVGVIGFSAGGHLASTLCTHFNEKVYPVKDTVAARPDFAVLVYPVITMNAQYTHIGSRNNLLGPNPDSTKVLKYSNELQVTNETPTTILFHSANDDVVPVENSIDYFNSLQKNKIPSEMHIFQVGGHGYGLGRGNATETKWPEECILWLKVNNWI